MQRVGEMPVFQELGDMRDTAGVLDQKAKRAEGRESVNKPLTRNMLKIKSHGGGLKCPACGAQSAVNQTRDEGTVVKRTRGCPGCGYRFRTVEMIRCDYYPRLRIALETTG